jgi:predicted transcriptional regulator
MAALQKFLQAELPRRGWTIPHFAKRAALSTSLAYQIADGKDNLRLRNCCQSTT